MAYNNDFFSYNGTIGRKDYTINMLILIALLIGIFFLRIDVFKQYINPAFLYDILTFVISLFKFVVIMSMLSLIYRRIADISYGKTPKFNEISQKIFGIIFVFPTIYLLCIRFFIDIIPFIQNILDLFSIFVLIPIGIIISITLCIIKKL